MKKILNIIFSKTFMTGFLIIIQIVYIVLTVIKFAELRVWLDNALKILSLLMSLMIIRRDDNSSYKVVWIFTMGLFPVLGGLMYLVIGSKRPARKLRRTLDASIGQCVRNLEQSPDVTEKLPARMRSLCGYISRYGGCPVNNRSYVKYFSYGENFFEIFLEELEKAEKYIFLEYFMIFKGVMWDRVFEILSRKAAAGVDIRIIYDDMGSMTFLPEQLKKGHVPDGIKTVAFNPFIPVFSVVMNHRDHRKIAVIDGVTAFTGGINISDEYINETHPFGRWKDTAIMVKGKETVFCFTVMFAGMWNAFHNDKIECRSYAPEHSLPCEDDNFTAVQPFCDSPLDNEQVSETIYIDILAQAERYVYIFTPYLIIDDRMRSALTAAAKRGVDVRIVTPGIPDKKLVFRVTRSYYESLMNAGVRIYEYTPGFIHAKSYLSDDKIAVVGSVNMDFRSLYLHFECGALIYSENGSEVLEDIFTDCMETFELSREIKPSESHRFSRTLTDSVLRVFSPLI